jgi:uncharacterized protein with HEPN domain
MAQRDDLVTLRQMLDHAKYRLIHAYDTVDNDVLWLIVKSDLPKLAKALEGKLRPRERT